MLIGSLFALLSSLASISLLALSGWFITSAALAGLLAPDSLTITFNFVQPAAEIRALALVRTLSRYAERLVTHDATFKGLAEIRHWFFASLIPLVPGRLSMKRSADLLASMTQDIDALNALYLRLLSPLLIVLLAGGVCIFFIASYSFYIALLVFTLLVFSVLIMPWLFYRLGQQGATQLIEQASNFKAGTVEIIQGMADLKAFNAYEYFENQLTSVSEQMLKTQKNNHHLLALSTAISLFFSQMTVLIALIIGGSLFQQGYVSGEHLIMLSFCVLAMIELTLPLSSFSLFLTKTVAAAKRIRSITNLQPMIKEPVQPKQIEAESDIKIDNLSFRYADNSDWVLKNINLTIEHGSKVALIGKSGVGKTTLLHIIMRFFDPQQGSIKFGGINCKQLSSVQLMEKFSVLSQQTQLFSGTIKQNLLIAKPTASDEEIHNVLNRAGLNKFVTNLPRGINTWIGESGVTVSSGEGRRIALARVYLKNAPILLLDEPTEGLDRETADSVLNVLKKISKDKTMILVTHCKKEIELVDRVVKL